MIDIRRTSILGNNIWKYDYVMSKEETNNNISTKDTNIIKVTIPCIKIIKVKNIMNNINKYLYINKKILNFSRLSASYRDMIFFINNSQAY